MRYLKIIGLATMAALMASVMFASAAQAQTFGTLTAGETTSTHKPATITTEQYPDPWETGEEWNFFAPTPGVGEEEKIRCDTANLEATTETGTEETLTVKPKYIHCSAGTQPATVNMNGCDYTLTRPFTVPRLNTGRYTGKVDLTCPGHNKIEVTVFLFGNPTQTTDSFPVCTIKVYPKASETVGGHTTHELGGHIIYQNISDDPHDITASVNVTGITVEDGCNGGHSEEGVYKQTLTIKAFEDEKAHTAENQLDLWLSDE